jgi:DNA-binding TFAR19-related protein (PDSD5 family)
VFHYQGGGPGGGGGDPQGQQQKQQQQREQVEDMKNSILSQVLTQEARARCEFLLFSIQP